MRTFVELAEGTRLGGGQAQEIFLFAVRDGKAVLTRYDIQSQELILR